MFRRLFLVVVELFHPTSSVCAASEEEYYRIHCIERSSPRLPSGVVLCTPPISPQPLQISLVHPRPETAIPRTDMADISSLSAPLLSDILDSGMEVDQLASDSNLNPFDESSKPRNAVNYVKKKKSHRCSSIVI
jgi:hypothetical protein